MREFYANLGIDFGLDLSNGGIIPSNIIDWKGVWKRPGCLVLFYRLLDYRSVALHRNIFGNLVVLPSRGDLTPFFGPPGELVQGGPGDSSLRG
jgi:hypothetical protein